MKNSLYLLLAVFALVSCSRDDSSAPTFGSGELEKVIFYRDSSTETQWIFENKLLTKITLADGTLVEAFVYDNLNRLVQDKKYDNGTLTATDVITYNADHTIKTINNLPYTFDSATRTYTYTYGSDFTINCEVNSDQLAVNFVRMGSNSSEYHMTYAGGNMTSYTKLSDDSTSEVKNFYFDAGFGSNPIYEMILPVARVKSLTDPGFFTDCQVSKNLANGFDKGSSYPLHYNYGAVPDIEGKLFQIGVEVLDGNNNNVDFYSFTDYIYL
jgi:hypothetical protein